MGEATDLEEAKSVKVKTRTGSYKYDYDELFPEVHKIVIMSDHVRKNKRMDVAKKITKAIIDGKIKNADISSDLATLIGVNQPYPGAAPRGVVKDQMKKLKLESADLEEATMDKIKAIIADKQRAKIGGKMIDLQTASAIIQIYDKVNPETKKKMENEKIDVLLNILTTLKKLKL